MKVEKKGDLAQQKSNSEGKPSLMNTEIPI